MENEKYESIKSKIRKLVALAQGGTPGEIRNAKHLIDKLCREYNISLDDVINNDNNPKYYKIYVGKKKIDVDLFVQCYSKITGNSSLKYFREGRAEIIVELTPYQYAELISLYEWHKSNFKKEIDECLKTLFLSYCLKHNLDSGSIDNDEVDTAPLTAEQIRRLMTALKMTENLNDNKYHKLIGGYCDNK